MRPHGWMTPGVSTGTYAGSHLNCAQRLWWSSREVGTKFSCWLAQPKLSLTVDVRLRGFAATADNLRLAPERRLASLLPASWNQIASWVKQIEALRSAHLSACRRSPIAVQ